MRRHAAVALSVVFLGAAALASRTFAQRTRVDADGTWQETTHAQGVTVRVLTEPSAAYRAGLGPGPVTYQVCTPVNAVSLASGRSVTPQACTTAVDLTAAERTELASRGYSVRGP